MVKSVYWQDVIFPGDIADLSGIGPGGVIVPSGTTATRPLVPINGTIRYNTTLLQTEIFQNGSWQPITTAGVTGYTTASNLGAGQPILASSTIPNLQFRSLVAGTNVTLATGANTITINAPTTGEVNTGNNTGTGVGVFDSKVGSVLNFQTLATTTPGAISITPSGGGEINIDFIGSVGEINTGTNLSLGASVFESKIGTTLRFRTLISAGSPLTITQNPFFVLFTIDPNPVFVGTEALRVPRGTLAQRPGAASNGMIRYNTDSDVFEGFVGGSWTTIETSTGVFVQIAGDTMTGPLTMNGANINMNAGADLFLNGGSITLNGLTSDVDLTAGRNVVMAPGNTVDGRDVSADGIVLDAINAANGMIARTGPGAFASRTIQGTANEIVVTNGAGTAGDPTIGIADNPVLTGTGSVTIPVGNTAQRPGAPVVGMLRHNTATSAPEIWFAGAWQSFITSAGGTISGGNLDMGTNDIINLGLVDGRDVSADGLVIDELNAIITDTGFVAKSGGTLVSRLVSASLNPALGGIDVIGGDGTTDVEIGLDINNLMPLGSVDGADELVILDTSGNINAKTTVQDIADFVGTSGLDALYVNVTGDTVTGDITFSGGDIVMDDNRSSAVGTPGATISTTGDFTINGIPISVTAGDDATAVASAINTDPAIITNGTIFADVIGSPDTLRIYSIGLANLVLADTTNAPLVDMGITPGTYIPTGLIDGRDVSRDGLLIDEIDVGTELGFLSRIADGLFVGNFERRTFTASAAIGLLGIDIVNGDGIAGDPEIGININSQGALTPLKDADEILVWDSATSTNLKTTGADIISYVRANTNNSAIRVSSTNPAIPSGLTPTFNFTTIGIDVNSHFDNLNDEYTPPAGTYRFGLYIEVGAVTPAGRYIARFRRNGTAEGNTLVIESDATNTLTAYIEDMFDANGTDVFTVEIENTTGGASQIVAVRWIANRVY